MKHSKGSPLYKIGYCIFEETETTKKYGRRYFKNGQIVQRTIVLHSDGNWSAYERVEIEGTVIPLKLTKEEEASVYEFLKLLNWSEDTQETHKEG